MTIFVDVRCTRCNKLLCKVSHDFHGVVQVRCRHCKYDNHVSLATVMKLIPARATLESTRTPAQ